MLKIQYAKKCMQNNWYAKQQVCCRYPLIPFSGVALKAIRLIPPDTRLTSVDDARLILTIAVPLPGQSCLGRDDTRRSKICLYPFGIR